MRRNGLTVRKRSPDLLLAIHLLSPDKTYDLVYISNYGLLNVRDKLMRLYGVADVSLFGVREYSMRIWLDPERIALRGLTAEQVLDGCGRRTCRWRAARWASRRSTTTTPSRSPCR